MNPTEAEIWAEAEVWRHEVEVICRRRWQMTIEESEDAASDAIAKVGAAPVRDLKAVRNMLHQFCEWRAKEGFRRSTRRDELTADLRHASRDGSGSQWQAFLAAGAETASAEFQNTEVLHLREALEAVEPHYAAAIMLQYWGFKQREAAEALHITKACYKTWLYRGREAVKLVMAESWAELDICRDYISKSDSDRTKIAVDFRRRQARKPKQAPESSNQTDDGVPAKS